MIQSDACDHHATDEHPAASMCQHCPPRRCDQCDGSDSIDKPCPCWVALKGKSPADVKWLLALAGLSVEQPR